MACYAFTTNVTGHAIHFAKHMISGNFFEMFVVLAWLFAFMFGAGLAHFLIRSFEYKGPNFAQVVPIFVVVCLLVFIGLYGHYIHEERDRDVLIISSTLLLTMGIQNSAINIISDGKIKTSHLTGLFTDLGADISKFLQKRSKIPAEQKQKIRLRASILCCYIGGAILGGWLFTKINFATFYLTAAILFLLLSFDLLRMNLKKKI